MATATRETGTDKPYQAASLDRLLELHASSSYWVREAYADVFVLADDDKKVSWSVEAKKRLRSSLKHGSSYPYLRYSHAVSAFWLSTYLRHARLRLVDRADQELSSSSAVDLRLADRDPERTLLLLGGPGRLALERVVNLIREIVRSEGWPVAGLELQCNEDPEVEGWRYAVLTLVFDADFESADMYLHEFYQRVDALATELEDEEQGALRRMLFFEIRTDVPDR